MVIIKRKMDKKGMIMTGKMAGLMGMGIGILGLLIAGLIDPFTNTLLICGSIVLASGIIATAISSNYTEKKN